MLERVWIKGTLLHCWWECKLVQPLWRTVWRFLKKLEIELPYEIKKIRDTTGIFHTKMGTIKDRNSIDVTEAKDIKKRWQEYTEELYKKDLHDPDNYNGMITHLEPDILECEVKWALGSITMNKVSGGDGIPLKIKT